MTDSSPTASQISWKSTFKEIAAGSFGGVIQVLVGQPFDTVKVRLQSQGSAGSPTYNGTLDCVSKTIRNEGPLAFYKGTLSPLIGIAFCVSIQFATLESMKRSFVERNKSNGRPDPTMMSPFQLYLAGGVAGLANSIVSGPVEHIRTRMQVQVGNSASGKPQYASTIDCFRQIQQQYGLRGVYKGQMVTLLREWQGYGGYFLAYELLAQMAIKANGGTIRDLPIWQVMSFGAIAGYAMWIPVFPIDAMKSRLQTDSLDVSKQRYKGIVDCFRKIIQSEGVGGLYRGFLPCMLRAAPVNAATFVAYEFALNILGRQ